MMSISEDEVIDYWYSPEVSQQWFASTEQLDSEIRAKFETLWQGASRGELDHWQATPLGCLGKQAPWVEQ